MIRYQIYRCVNKAAQLLNISILYETSTGIKAINKLIPMQETAQNNEFYVEPKDLFLGFDALKDQFSLVDVCINRSPHYDFMVALSINQNVRKTDYCRRYKAGTLDSRSGVYLSTKMVNNFRKVFEKRKKEIAEDSYAPVKVYKIDNKLYIADGKHRAALCALMGKKVKCVEISNDFLKDSYKQWIYMKMCKRRVKYSRNISLFEKSGSC